MAADQARPPQSSPLLVPFAFWLEVAAPARLPSLPSLRAAIAAQLGALGSPGADPLRWAITAVDPGRGLHLEGVAVSAAPPAGAPARL